MATFIDDIGKLLLCPNRYVNNRIVNGCVARPKQFPYQVGLEIIKNDNTYWCGGSLISTSFVLTAAHCAIGGIGGIAYLGAVDISNPNEVGQVRQTLFATSFIPHQDYNEETLIADLALVKLSLPVSTNDYIKVIPLPKLPYESYDLDEGRVSGWGKLHDFDNSKTNILHYGDVLITPNLMCELPYAVDETMICSVGLQSVCNGDSGGPLAVLEGNNYVLVGITSFGSALACELPAVYTRVTSYIAWIYSNMAANT
ncbi:chymotrypsin BI-like [Cochliomyia hominivorax]